MTLNNQTLPIVMIYDDVETAIYAFANYQHVLLISHSCSTVHNLCLVRVVCLNDEMKHAFVNLVSLQYLPFA